jgi:hypothetical protein
LIYKGFKEGDAVSHLKRLRYSTHHGHAPLMELRQNEAPRLWPQRPPTLAGNSAVTVCLSAIG